MHAFIRQSKISALSSLGPVFTFSPVFSSRKFTEVKIQGFPCHLNSFIQPQSQTSQNTHGDWYILGYMVGSYTTTCSVMFNNGGFPRLLLW